MPRGPRQRGPEAKNWCYTINNWTEVEWTDIIAFCNAQPPAIRYAHMVTERGGEDHSGTPHIQGYVQFLSKKRLSAVKRFLGNRSSCRVARGSVDDQTRYFSKDKDYDHFQEFKHGEPMRQGTRTDWNQLRDTISEGVSYRHLVTEYPEHFAKCIMYPAGISRAIGAFIKPRGDAETFGVWLYGETGAGKSHDARLMAKATSAAFGEPKSVYTKPDSTKWWPLYHGERSILWQDIRVARRGALSPDMLLNLLDSGDHQVQVKNGYVHFNSGTVVFTSPVSPQEFFLNAFRSEDPAQFVRRIDCIVHYTGKYINGNVNKRIIKGVP